MLEALIITLREGIEAALVVGIVYAFLKKEGLERQLRAVWAGLVTAIVASLVGAWALHSVAINEEAFEGVLYVVSALMVGSMVIWMWRQAADSSRRMKEKLAAIAARGNTGAVFAGVFLFTFLMVFREGVETALFLAAVSLTTSGLLTLLGSLAGLALAVWFGVLFIRGSVRMDLGRFFKVTGVALLIFVVQLLLNGYHELSEAGWLPASPETMATVGPLVRNEFFFIVAVLALPLLAIAFPGTRREEAAAVTDEGPNAAARRLALLDARRQKRTRAFAGSLGIAILALLGLGFTYARSAPTTPIEPLVASGGEVRLPLAALGRNELHRYSVDSNGHSVRFIAMRLEGDEVVAAFDACVICGAKGYTQEGGEVLCQHCSSAIFPPTIGRAGGCNPIPLEFSVDGDAVIVSTDALAEAADLFAGDGAPTHHAMANMADMAH